MEKSEAEGSAQSGDAAGGELIVAADLGGTNLRAAAVDRDGRIHGRTKISTPREGGADAIVRAIVSAARQFELEGRERGERVMGVSVVVPGTVRVETGVVTQAPNIPSLDGYPLSETLRTELGLPALVENDANAAAVGEMWQGAGRGRNTIICLTLGTGVGGGIILDRKLWRGVDGSAGELGHIAVESLGGAPCACGSRGCLEVYASATAIARMAREEAARFPESQLARADELTAEAVYRSGTGGDELALEVFRRMGTSLGVGVASLLNIFNPEAVIIGGGAAGGWDLFIPHVREQVAERAFKIPAARAEIVRAEQGDDAGLLGAAYLAFQAV